MTKRQSNTWNKPPRLSAGGANRTNIRRPGFNELMRPPEGQSGSRPSSSDLLPRQPRMSSFRPWNSRLNRRSESVFAWEPQPSWQYDHRLPQKERSPGVLLDEKGRMVPKKGMFQNAKYSESVRPIADEALIRRTEQVIRRIAEPRRVSNNELRDRIRQVVYDLGVPPNYRAPSVEHFESERFRNCQEESEEDEEEKEEEVVVPERKRHKETPKEKSFEEKRTRRTDSIEEKSEDSFRSGSKNSSIVLTTPPKFVRDPDEEEEWRNALPFMSQANGTAMFDRIASEFPSLPLKDNTRDSYSRVALMLLDKSMKNTKTPGAEPEQTLQAQLMNMSTCWARQEAPALQCSLADEVSRIQNAAAAPINESLFHNSTVFESDKAGRTVQMKRIPPPLFRSSPVQNDVVRSSEGITMQSSIRKEAVDSEEEEEEGVVNQCDVDDYIAQGASQIDFSQSRDVFLSASSRNAPDFMQKSTEQTFVEPKSLPTRSKSKTETSSLHLNSRFLLARQKNSQPVLDFDAETEKIFEDMFDDESGSSSSNRRHAKFSF